MKDLLGALAHAHSWNIAHRDIKPDNIMWGDDGHVRLVDFGLALQGKQNMVRSVGTPYFMPPEVVGHFEYTKKCDLWSLGCVMYMMVEGRFAFLGKTRDELFSKISTGLYVAPKFCSDDCKDLLSKMLVVDPDKRFSA